jgi:hypothetical protein
LIYLAEEVIAVHKEESMEVSDFVNENGLDLQKMIVTQWRK